MITLMRKFEEPGGKAPILLLNPENISSVEPIGGPDEGSLIRMANGNTWKVREHIKDIGADIARWEQGES